MIRPYKIEDKEKLIDLLRFNIPQYFDPAEESDFIAYLKCFTDNYFVVEENGQIIGCGGFNYSEYSDEKSIANISWDIIHPDFHGKGIGKKLTQFRINKIKQNATINIIRVRTTQ